MKEIILSVLFVFADIIGALMVGFALDKLFLKKQKCMRNIIFILIGTAMCIATIVLAEKFL